MTVIEKTYKIKTFGEFTEEEQKKILDIHREMDVEGFDLVEVNNFQEIVEAMGFLEPEVSYDISGCQGSGTCFDCNKFDFDLLLKDYECKHKKMFIDLLKNGWVELDITRNYFATHYCHSRTRDLRILSTKELLCYSHLVETFKDILEYCKNQYQEACYSLHKAILNEYDYLTSDETVKDLLITNEYFFNEHTYRIESGCNTTETVHYISCLDLVEAIESFPNYGDYNIKIDGNNLRIYSDEYDDDRIIELHEKEETYNDHDNETN